MSAAENTEPKVEETKPEESKVTSSAVFSMFGGGAKKEKKDEEDRGDNSGSAKAQRDAAAENEVCTDKSTTLPLRCPALLRSRLCFSCAQAATNLDRAARCRPHQFIESSPSRPPFLLFFSADM
jgi:hypothetical protein